MKYQVNMILGYRKDITVYADDTQEAEEKATELCLGWNNVVTADVEDILEVEQ